MKTPERFRTQLRDALQAHADGLASQEIWPLPVRRPRRAITRLVPSAAAAVIAAAAAAVILASGGTVPPPASAGTVLYASAAALQRSGPSLELGPHSYLYVRSVTRSMQAWYRGTSARLLASRKAGNSQSQIACLDW